MNPLLEQFLLEARDFLQGIGEKLMALEDRPEDTELMTELFRLVHTLKGNSGLFDFPEMTRVLHAGEDLMDAVREGRLAYSQTLADRLLDAMDLVGAMLDEIENTGVLSADMAEPAQAQVNALRALIPARVEATTEESVNIEAAPDRPAAIPIEALPETARLAAFTAAACDAPLFRVRYFPDAECFFKGEDPLYQARNVPGLAWGTVLHKGDWPPLAEMDCYRCEIYFDMLVRASREELVDYFRYVPNEVEIEAVPLSAIIVPQGHPNGGPVYGDFVAEALSLLKAGDMAGLSASVETMLELSAPELWLSSALRWLQALIHVAPGRTRALHKLIESLGTLTPPMWTAEDFGTAAESAVEPETQAEAKIGADTAKSPRVLDPAERALLDDVLAVQGEILALPDHVDWLSGRLKACAATLAALLARLGETTEELDEALAESLAAASARPLSVWLAAFRESLDPACATGPEPVEGCCDVVSSPSLQPEASLAPFSASAPPIDRRGVAADASDAEPKFGRRAEDAPASKVLKVDQAKVDRLMSLIGEMVVAKNSLPYLARRAEDEFGVRELAREIKAQYAVINRIAEEMQDAIMQVRMMPVSFVFQRFPRLVRDISRKLGKEVELVLEGEETEADKTIVEALADPLIHIVRNSLDHGIELPEVRQAAGKPAVGRLVIRAQQESDRVVIEVIDDGKGIDPGVVKRKAYEKGLIDENQLERISDAEAQKLIFAPGFSTAEQISDLSGRGVGMDVVRNALDKVGGTVELKSVVGQGTALRLTLPLSMAVTNVMIIESDGQIFGVPMEMVMETVRLPRSSVRTLKHRLAAVLRGRIVPLMALNALLGLDAEPKVNADDEFAVLVVKIGTEPVGLLVDGFSEVVDVILKPLPGGLSRLSCYAGAALLGDGSVLMVINPKELLR